MPSIRPSWRKRRQVSRSPDGRVSSPFAIALVVAAVPVEHAGIGAGVDVVDARSQGGQSAGDERLAQPVGGQRQICHDAKPTEALTEHGPALDAERVADPLGVAHDRVGPEVREVLGLFGGRAPGERSDRGGAPGATLVEQEHAEVLKRAVHPSGVVRVAGRAGRLESRTALEVHEEREVAPVGTGQLASEYGYWLARVLAVIERDLERVLDCDQPGQTYFGAHIGQSCPEPKHRGGTRRVTSRHPGGFMLSGVVGGRRLVGS
jgi:hypothetical protein